MAIWKQTAFLWSFLLLSPAHAEVAPTERLTLQDCYKLALDRSEDFASQQERTLQAEEKSSQATGALFPTITGYYSVLKQETPPGNVSNLYRSQQTSSRIAAVQPLFQGFKEYAALKQTDRLKEAGKFNEEHARILVFQDVVQTFYQVLLLEQDLKNLENEITVSKKRHQDLIGFRKIGRSRQTEVLTFEANIASLEAERDAVKAQLDTARSNLAFLTGQSRNVNLVDQETVPARLESLDHYTSKIETRPDIKSLSATAAASDQGITIARGGHLPTVDLLGNYYFQRPGSLNEINWDVQLALTIPIFQGGIVMSQVREAASKAKQSDLALSRARRAAQEQIETLYFQIQSDYSQIEKQKKASELASKNYEAELKDYRLGLVTNLEVLQAMTVSQGSQRILDRTQFQLKQDYLKLMSSIAERPKL